MNQVGLTFRNEVSSTQKLARTGNLPEMKKNTSIESI